ncbi:uncharacterized protein [Ptychodera flava]|uniref:uncharacterized protein n=1 Tax=Ptychodera flava TaxID=63121 RepID=UPI00396A8B39
MQKDKLLTLSYIMIEDRWNPTELQALKERFLNLNQILDIQDLESGITKERQQKAVENSATFPKLETFFKNVILTKRTLQIGVSGGSISTATCVGKRNYYVEKLKNNLEEILHTEVEIFNGALNASGSLFHTYCMDNYLNLTCLDVLLWECSVNDKIYHHGCSPQEEFTRKVLQVANGPQLVYVNFVTGFRGHSCQSNEDSCSKPLSEHYNVPSLNMKAALCDLIEQGEAGTLACPVDHCHPNVRYHSVVGNLLTRMLGNVLMGVIEQMAHSSRPLSTDDKKELGIALPLPLINTTKLTGTQCWSTAIAETGNSNPLVPILNGGSHDGSTGEDQVCLTIRTCGNRENRIQQSDFKLTLYHTNMKELM